MCKVIWSEEYSKRIYLAYEKVQQVAGQIDELPFFNIPWWHNVILLTKLKDTDERLWYAQKSIENGWSRNTLELWLESNLYHREGKAITNFSKTLTEPQSDMAQQSLKDPYLFDFLTLHEACVEKDVEQGLIDHIQKFLLELGQGFAAEYALRNISSPIGVAEYTTKLVEKLPKELKGSLPTIEEIEAGISKKEDRAKVQKARRKK